MEDPEQYNYGVERLWTPGGGIKDWPVRIVGLAHTGVVLLGRGYVVELLRPIAGYEYTHTVAFEYQLH